MGGAKTIGQVRPLRTVGCEPELTSVGERLRKTGRQVDVVDRLVDFFGTKPEAVELAGSHFQQLFSLQGREPGGPWVEGLIPSRIVTTDAFAAARKALGKGSIQTTQGGTFYRGWGSLDGEKLLDVLYELFELRGQYADDLMLRKVPAAWSGDAHPLDAFIPAGVAEEWRHGHFNNIEFPMTDGTHTERVLTDYMRHMYLRLGLVSSADPELVEAAAMLPAHVHWLPHLGQLPDTERFALYDAMVQFWGEANDRHLLIALAPEGATPEAGRLTLTRGLTYQLATGPDYGQYSILPLTLVTYRRLEATPDGVHIDRRFSDLDPRVDGNFPPCFKRLAVGIRGKLGAPVTQEDAPIPTVHLEGRSGESIRANLDMLPAADPITGEIDVDALLACRGRGPFGLVSDTAALKARALELGLDPALVEDVLVLLARGPDDTRPVVTRGWPREVYQAAVLLPLTPWLERPLIQSALSRLEPKERQAFETRFTAALDAWAIRMRDIGRARREPEFEYQPDWSQPLLHFPDGFNRLFPRDVSDLEFTDPGPYGNYNFDPDYLFTQITRSEAVRFVIESGLGELMKRDSPPPA